jgi:membrane-associated phospholipid phosphatase
MVPDASSESSTHAYVGNQSTVYPRPSDAIDPDETSTRRGTSLEDSTQDESQHLTSARTDLELGGRLAAEQPEIPTISRRSRIAVWILSQKFLEESCCFLFLLLCLVPTFVKPSGNQRPIPFQYLAEPNEHVRNLDNNQTAKGPTVSDAYLLLFGIALPFVVQLCSSCWGKIDDSHATICATLVAQGANLLVTECVKLYVGYLRPVFYEFCVPSSDYQQCTGTTRDVSESRKSFPSGHASTAFCGLTLLALFLHHRFGLPSVRTIEYVQVGDGANRPVRLQARVTYASPRPIVYRFLSLVVVGGPMSVAIFIAVSRVVDNYHFPADVVAGSVLGSSISLFVSGLWFEY